MTSIKTRILSAAGLAFGLMAAQPALAHMTAINPGVAPGDVQSGTVTLPGGQQAPVIDQATCEAQATGDETCTGGALFVRTDAPLASGTSVSYVIVVNGQSQSGTGTVGAGGTITGALAGAIVGSRTGLETIMVSGTKREADSQSVPISVSAISEQQLANTFRADVLAVGDLAPNVALGQVAGFRAVAGGIRGTGQNSILVTQDSSVVILVDEFGYTRVQSQFVPLFDVERVEVFRGPQGTLFGKSATGGAISIVTKRPIMNEFSADVEFQIGKFNSGAKGMIGKGRVAVNVPVVEDKLAIRVTGLYDYDDGYYRNDRPASAFPQGNLYYRIPTLDLDPNAGFDPTSPTLGADTSICAAAGSACDNGLPYPSNISLKNRGDGERLNGTDVFAGTVKALFTPTDNYEAYFIFRVLRDRSDSPPGVNETPAGQGFLLPLLGFDGIDVTGGSIYSTGVDNSCWDQRAFCIPRGHRVNVEEYHLHQKLSLDEVTLQLLIGYRDHEEILPSTYTGEAFRSLFDASRNTKEEQFQIELRASTEFDGPFNFVFGATYQTHDVDMLSYATVGLTSLITLNPPVPGGTSVFDVNGNEIGLLDADGALNIDTRTLRGDHASGGARQDRETYAVYLDGSFEVTDTLTFTAGMRYTYDKKDFFRRANPGGPCTVGTDPQDENFFSEVDGALVPDAAGDICLDARSNAISRALALGFEGPLDPFNLPYPDSAFGIASGASESWDKVTWRAVIDWQFSDEGLAYVSYATGFIPGGFTETCSSIDTCRPFESETNWNIEGGVKAQWFDGTLQTNFALFYTRYSNLVRSQVVPFTNAFGVTTQETININAGKSEVLGVELEVVWVPTENLRFDLGVGFMDHDYVEFVLNGDDLSDLTVPFSPKWSLNIGITYDVPLGNSGMLTFNTTGNYQSEAEFSVFNSDFTQLSSRFLWDANITYRDADERYRVTLFVKNILDEEYRIAANSVAGLWNFTQWGRPMEFGAEVGFYF
ncbi:MAG: TonB-dependent receptor [Alphaproteobacteria bacterium]